MDFGRIRSVAQAPPSEEAWERVCEAIEGLTGPDLERALGYLDGILRSWPDELRVPAGAWKKKAWSGVESPETSIVRTLHVCNPSDSFFHRYRSRAAPNVRHARALHVESFEGSLPAFSDALSELPFGALERLRLTNWKPANRRHWHNDQWAGLGEVIGSYPGLRALEFSAIKKMNRRGIEELFSKDVDVDEVRLERSGLDELGVGALARACAAGGWESLDVGGNAAGDGGWMALAGHDLGSLRSLRLDRMGAGDPGAAALAQSSLGGLRHLSVCHNRMSAAGLVGLIESVAGSLDVLECDLVGEEGEVAQALERLDGLDGLRHMKLRLHTGDDAAVVASLEATGALDGLESLSLQGLDPEGLAALVASPRLSRLAALDVSKCELSDGFWEALVGNDALASLRSLELSHVTSEARKGLRTFAKGEGLESLSELTFAHCDWRPMQYLAGSDRVASLARLSLLCVGLSPKDARSTFGDPRVERLESITFHPHKGLTQKVADELVRPEYKPKYWHPVRAALKARSGRR